MSPRAIKKAVDGAWIAFQSLTYEWLGSRDIDQLERRSVEAERGHRRFMRGAIRDGYHAGYSVSVETAARLIALQQVYQELRSRKKPSFEMAATVRPDVVTAWHIALQLKTESRRYDVGRAKLASLRKTLRAIDDIDYAKDCTR